MFSKNTQISNFVKIRQVEAGFFPCGRTDWRDEANSRITQFLERT